MSKLSKRWRQAHSLDRFPRSFIKFKFASFIYNRNLNYEFLKEASSGGFLTKNRHKIKPLKPKGGKFPPIG